MTCKEFWQEIFKEYREDGDWDRYEHRYMQLLKDRDVSGEIDRALFQDGAVLLCSEPTPEKCHRRLAAELLRDEVLGDTSIVHL